MIAIMYVYAHNLSHSHYILLHLAFFFFFCKYLSFNSTLKKMHSFFKKFILFIYFWLCWVFVAVHGLSLVEVSGGYSSMRCAVFSLQWLLFCGARALGTQASVVVARGLSSCGLWALEHRLRSCGARA